MHKFMRMAIDESRKNLTGGKGGPFGAVIVKDGEVIAAAHNRVLETNDPTMHAEIGAIRLACERLGTFDLSGCELYTSCEPCPMCLAAIAWAKIHKFYFGCTREDAARIGFDDKAMYDYLAGDLSTLPLAGEGLCREEAQQVFDEWMTEIRKMY